MKKFFLAFIACGISASAWAQDFEVPKGYLLDEAADYTRLNDEVLHATDWLINTPIGEQQEMRKEVAAFFMKWIAGTPTVSIEIQPNVITFIEEPDLFLIYMAGWTKYAIKSGDGKDKISGTTAGLEAVMAFYTTNREQLGKVKSVEKYIKMKHKGKLKDFIKKNA